jgi:hypothetical protein
MGDDHSAHHTITLGVAYPTFIRLVGPFHASTGFVFIDKSGIWFRHLNPQHER